MDFWFDWTPKFRVLSLSLGAWLPSMMRSEKRSVTTSLSKLLTECGRRKTAMFALHPKPCKENPCILLLSVL